MELGHFVLRIQMNLYHCTCILSFESLFVSMIWKVRLYLGNGFVIDITGWEYALVFCHTSHYLFTDLEGVLATRLCICYQYYYLIA